MSFFRKIASICGLKKKKCAKKVCYDDNPVVTIFGASAPKPNSPEYIVSEKLGKYLSTKKYTIRNGGYSGTMEGSAKGAKENQGHCEGCIVTKVFTHRPHGNEYLTHVIDHNELTSRLNTLTNKDVSAIIILPGSIGTATELLLIMCLKYINVRNCAVFVWKKPFEKFVDNMFDCGITKEHHKNYFIFVENENDFFKKFEVWEKKEQLFRKK